MLFGKELKRVNQRSAAAANEPKLKSSDKTNTDQDWNASPPQLHDAVLHYQHKNADCEVKNRAWRAPAHSSVSWKTSPQYKAVLQVRWETLLLISGSAWPGTLLIPVAWNYKSVLSRLPFSGNRAAGDYRCEEQIRVLDLLSPGLDNFSSYKRYWKRKISCGTMETSHFLRHASHSNIVSKKENAFSLEISS